MNLLDFPPFYTLQPNLESRSKQLRLWKEYILEISSSKRKYTLDHTIFTNKTINRNCSSELIDLIIKELINSGIFFSNYRKCRV